MQIYRVLDMKVEEGEDVYLIQWLGDNRDSSQWLAKSYIKRNHPKQLSHLQDFDNNFAKKCSQIRSSHFQPARNVNRVKRTSNKEPQESNQLLSQVKANSTAESGENIRKKGAMTLRHGSDQVVNKAKTLLQKQKSSLSVSSDQFKIGIFTQTKLQDHWAYKDFVQQILAKRGSNYQIMWNNGAKAEVTEQELMERESIKLCEFWEKKLGIIPSKKCKE